MRKSAVDRAKATVDDAPGEMRRRKRGPAPKSASGAGVMISLRIPPDAREELRELAASLVVTQTEVLLWGLDVARRKARVK